MAAMPAAYAAAADSAHVGLSAEATFIAKIVLLLLAGRGLGELFERFGQPAVMGQLIGGILLGPSLFGWIWPSAHQLVFPDQPAQKSMMDAVSQLGILMLLLLTGMEMDLKLVRKVGAACFSISATGVVLPFACGFALAQFLPQALLPRPDERVVAGLFLGTALSISSVKIVAMVVREMNFLRRDLGQVIVASAILEDTIGWVIIAITFGIATEGSLDLSHLALTIVEVAAFMAFSFTIGRRMVFMAIRWSNDTLRSEYAVVTVILIIMGLMAILTELIGVHTVLGAFVAGILVGESPILSSHIEAQLRGVITALFMPVFFGMAGLSADLTALADPTLFSWTIVLVLVASVGKFSGAFLGGRLAGLGWEQSLAIGSGMNARGSTEVIVASIGLSMGILSHHLFTMIVTMAAVTTLVMPPMLRWALARLPQDEQERRRVEREELDLRGFLPKLERLLVAADDSAVGTFTAYLAGLIGGSRGMPITVLKLDGGKTDDGSTGVQSPDEHLKEAEKGAKASATVVARDEGKPVGPIHLTARQEASVDGKTIAEEARKGYGMLLLGLGKAVTSTARFTKRVSDLSSGFDGPLALVLEVGKKADRMPQLGEGTVILVPVNGTEVSRRAAELALTLARPHRATVRALFVSRGPADGVGRSLSHRLEEAVLKEVVDLADRYDVPAQTSIATRGAAGPAISKESNKGAAMVVMGVTQRPGSELLFGETATTVLSNCNCPILFLTDERVRLKESEKEQRRSGAPVAPDETRSQARNG
jgi:Kef-type K+ transport system membrane component KefB/nucleotide-binding universal stress UspA family protein